jgi:hypothetical protein
LDAQGQGRELDTQGLVQGTARLEGLADGREATPAVVIRAAEVVPVADMAAVVDMVVATGGTEPISSLSVFEP